MSDLLDPRRTEFITICQELGLAISSWNKVEEGLLWVFVSCLAPAPPAVAVAVFWSIVSFDAKLAVVHSALESRHRYDPDVLTQWTTLKNRCGKRKKVRDQLAHSLVMEVSADGQTVETYLSPFGLKWFMTDFLKMRSHEFRTAKRPLRPQKSMEAPDIRRATYSFVQLGRDLTALERQLKAKEPPA